AAGLGEARLVLDEIQRGTVVPRCAGGEVADQVIAEPGRVPYEKREEVNSNGRGDRRNDVPDPGIRTSRERAGRAGRKLDEKERPEKPQQHGHRAGPTNASKGSAADAVLVPDPTGIHARRVTLRADILAVPRESEEVADGAGRAGPPAPWGRPAEIAV